MGHLADISVSKSGSGFTMKNLKEIRPRENQLPDLLLYKL